MPNQLEPPMSYTHLTALKNDLTLLKNDIISLLKYDGSYFSRFNLSKKLEKMILLDVNKYGESYAFEYHDGREHKIELTSFHGTMLLNVIYNGDHYGADYTLNLKTMKPTKNSKGHGILSYSVIQQLRNELKLCETNRYLREIINSCEKLIKMSDPDIWYVCDSDTDDDTSDDNNYSAVYRYDDMVIRDRLIINGRLEKNISRVLFD